MTQKFQEPLPNLSPQTVEIPQVAEVPQAAEVPQVAETTKSAHATAVDAKSDRLGGGGVTIFALSYGVCASVFKDSPLVMAMIGIIHWWTIEELIHTNETIFPRDLIINILESKSAGSSTLAAS